MIPANEKAQKHPINNQKFTNLYSFIAEKPSLSDPLPVYTEFFFKKRTEQTIERHLIPQWIA